MRSCPACGAEYTEKATVCSECQVTLVDGPAATAPDTDVELVRWERVYAAQDQVAAVMLRGVLEAENIPVRVEESTLAGYGPLLNAFKEESWGAILVPGEHAEEAALLIRAYMAGIDDDAATGEDDDEG